MGMYDEIIIEDGVVLPNFEKDPTKYNWQTKNLENLMRKYKITKEGRLLKKKIKWKKYTNKEKNRIAKEEGYKDYEDMVEKSPIESISNFREKEKEWWEDEDMHGAFEFYSYIEDKRWSYQAVFKNGKLSDLFQLE